MTEKINEASFKEKTPKKKSARPSFEIEGGEDLKKVAECMANLQEKTAHDQPVTVADMAKLREEMEKLTVEVGGMKIPLREIESSEELKANAAIWQEILAGKVIHVDKLTILPKEVAQALAQVDSGLAFDSLPKISLEVAQALAQDKSPLYFGGLQEISLEVAQALAQHKGGLGLSGLQEISVEVAQALAQKDEYLNLGGLQEISAEVARALASHKGHLFLDGLQEISEGVARALGQHKGWLTLTGLKKISEEAAQVLAQHEGRIDCGDMIKQQIEKYKEETF